MDFLKIILIINATIFAFFVTILFITWIYSWFEYFMDKLGEKKQ